MANESPLEGQVYWDRRDEGLVPVIWNRLKGRYEDVTWAPQPGSQEAFLRCGLWEVLYAGTRGPGKTDALLMDFAQFVGRGYGPDWRGILFRRTYPELGDVIAKSRKWFPKIFPNARYNSGEHFWTFPDGETLLFRHFKVPDDYWSYHGHAYPWIGWEELTTWPSPDCYTSMFSCSRSTVKSMPRRIRSTTNPYGVGHNWVKHRFRLPVPNHRMATPVIKDSVDKNGDLEPPRVAITGHINENQVLLYADPGYVARIKSAARNQNELDAWLNGSWDIVAGGMFDDVWDRHVHVLPNISLDRIPKGWKIDRSYDHGQSRPFSVGWWAESNGEPLRLNGVLYGPVRGDLIRIAEWYGWTGEPNVGLRMLTSEIAQGILDREQQWGIKGRVKAGVADASIFDQYEPGKSVVGEMRKVGVDWQPADKGQGSRKQGWEQLRERMKGSHSGPEGVRETPGIFVLESCQQFCRTVPVIARDDRDLDDVNTDAEDHIADEVRYRVRNKMRKFKRSSWG